MNERLSIPLSCCIEAPAAYAPKARYAVCELLRPLGLAPAWTAREAMPADGLYYGTRPEGWPETVLAVRLHEATIRFFDSRTAYDAEQVRWLRFEEEDWPVLFGTLDRDDFIASAFFWLSGWQEVTNRMRDQHGRFPHEASLQHQLGVLTRPPVDAYREVLAALLAEHGIATRRRTWGTAAWALCPTHDIDYLRKWRPGMIYRETVQYLLGNRRREPVARRVHRFGRFLRDWLRRGDVYRESLERLPREAERVGGTATFFFKTGAHGTHDVAYDTSDPYLHEHIAALEESGFEIGLHPSYYAHTHPFYLHDEHARLAGLATTRPISVRQHYLRYEQPATPRLQQNAGFCIDSTLGFAGHEGFRHGTCLPFRLFDLDANAPLDLWEMPLSVMEATIFNRRHLDVEEACAATQDILQTCKRFGGVAVVLWHNILWDELDHPGWGTHFTETLAHAAQEGALIASLHEALTAWLGAAPAPRWEEGNTAPQ